VRKSANPVQRYVAFLRAINVGGHTVKMDVLRKLFERLGFRNVETFIASGNVIFETPAGNLQQLEEQIARHLQNALGYEVTTFIRTPIELAEIAAFQPFSVAETEAPGTSLFIVFLPAPLSDRVQRQLRSFRTEADDFRVRGREIFWLSRASTAESPFARPLLGKTLGVPATVRNIKTVRKLSAKYPASPGEVKGPQNAGPRTQ